MTAEHIIGIYVVIDETMRALGHASHPRAGVSDAEVLTVAVVAAAFFGNHPARALAVLRATGYLARALSPARFSRRLHALADWLTLCSPTDRRRFATSSSTACRSRSASACGRGAGAPCAGGPTAATVPPSARSSSAGASIWSARRGLPSPVSMPTSNQGMCIAYIENNSVYDTSIVAKWLVYWHNSCNRHFQLVEDVAR